MERLSTVEKDITHKAQSVKEGNNMGRAIAGAGRLETIMRFIEKYPEFSKEGKGYESVFGNIEQQIKNSEGLEKRGETDDLGLRANIDAAYNKAKSMISQEDWEKLEKGE